MIKDKGSPYLNIEKPTKIDERSLQFETLVLHPSSFLNLREIYERGNDFRDGNELKIYRK